MGRKSSKRIDTSAEAGGLGAAAFASLNLEGLPAGKLEPEEVKEKKRSKIHTVKVRRLTAGKGGKTVTELTGFEADFFANRARLALKDLQKATGAGGTVKGQAIELQGDCRGKVQDFLESKGYRVVMAGG